MTYGLPDSMTYTMGRRVLNVVNDKGERRMQDLEVGEETAHIFVSLVAYAVCSPYFLIRWIVRRVRASKAVTEVQDEKAERYERYLQKKAQK